ncbi:MAG: Asp-tRNA(Asn)/Glu-tRNA(Gln) amidotransferase subunit GatA [Phycisphaerales bacterium]|nr:MAG: Asp-tRNA(Asn)/Glu-tRNA(Gln) amidotransferase subunit GatA [Phycisphaerales bacterium]
MTLMGVRDAVAAGEVSAVEAAEASLSRIDAHDGAVRAFVEVHAERALARAREVDARIAAGERVGALAGVPVALKDNMCTSWGRTTCSSRFLEGYESPYDATATKRLLDAGAVIVGKTNMDEFAMGSSCENSAFFPTRNPWDTTRVPGGSSGGSAACVAARMVSASLGSDTGGSIRQPAALCGLVGVKPTYGRVSRYGLVAFASSLDQIGPMTRTVADSALLMNVLCGVDPHDATSANVETPDFLRDLERPVEGLRLGVPTQAWDERNHPESTRVLREAMEVYRGLGAEIVEIGLPRMEYGIAAYYIIAPAEASSNLARFDGVRYGRRAALGRDEDLAALYARSRAEGFGQEVQRRIMLGTHVLSSGYYEAYYLTALKARRLIKADFDAAFASGEGGPGVHAVLMPATQGPAFRLGEKTDDPLAMYFEDLYTVTANLAGIGALSMPAGFAKGAGSDGEDLPLGVQLMCAPFDESRMLRIARMFERETGHGERGPGM